MWKNLIKDTVIYSAVDFLFKCFSFFTFPLFTHIFTPYDYGIIALVTTLGSFLATCSSLGMNSAVQRFYIEKSHDSGERPIIVSTGLLCLLVGTSCATFSALLLSWRFENALFQKMELLWIYLLISFLGNFPFLINTFALDLIRLQFKPWRFALIAMMQNCTGLGLSLLLVAKYSWGIKGFLLGQTVSLFFVLPLSLWNIRGFLRLAFRWEYARSMLQYGVPLVFTGVAYWMFGSMDRWMLAELSSTSETGLYSVAFRITTILSLMQTAFGQAWLPHALKQYESHKDHHPSYCSRSLTLWTFCLLIMGSALSLFGQEFLMLLTPKDYWQAAHTIPFIAMGLALYGTTQITALGISLQWKTYHLTSASWIAAGANFVLNMLLIPPFGSVGAALATFFSYGILAVYYFISCQRLYPLPLEYRKLTICLGGIFTTLLTYYMLQAMPYTRVLIGIKVSYIILLLCLGFIFRIFDFNVFETKEIKPAP